MRLMLGTIKKMVIFRIYVIFLNDFQRISRTILKNFLERFSRTIFSDFQRFSAILNDFLELFSANFLERFFNDSLADTSFCSTMSLSKQIFMENFLREKESHRMHACRQRMIDWIAEHHLVWAFHSKVTKKFERTVDFVKKQSNERKFKY